MWSSRRYWAPGASGDATSASTTQHAAWCCQRFAPLSSDTLSPKHGPFDQREYDYECLSTIYTPVTALWLLTLTASYFGHSQGAMTSGDVVWESTSGNSIVRDSSVITSGAAQRIGMHTRFQSKDLDLFPTDIASLMAQKFNISWKAATGQPVGSILPSRTGSADPSSNMNPSLSTGAKAGIGVGAALAALATLGIAVGALLRHRKKRNSATDTINPAEISELRDQDQHLAERKQFIDGRWRSEVETQRQIRELDSMGIHAGFIQGPPAELEGRDEAMVNRIQSQ